ncbi:MAG: hypothetical protein IJM09_00935 [Neisseriaceae bacterium]|nr:hypothetical protein [Neisseriaceae bacterium]
MSNEQLNVSFCLVRQNGLFLDNASIFFSGNLKPLQNSIGNKKSVRYRVGRLPTNNAVRS